MELSERDRVLIEAIADGLPLVSRPYAAVGETIGMSEKEVIERLGGMIDAEVIRRFGVIVRHRALGYRANAMVVWDVPDHRAREVGRRMSKLPFVTLCYQRPRRPPDWPYNLFCMVHGREREVVRRQVEALARDCGVEDAPHEILFSARVFKQRGARYPA